MDIKESWAFQFPFVCELRSVLYTDVSLEQSIRKRIHRQVGKTQIIATIWVFLQIIWALDCTWACVPGSWKKIPLLPILWAQHSYPIGLEHLLSIFCFHYWYGCTDTTTEFFSQWDRVQCYILIKQNRQHTCKHAETHRRNRSDTIQMENQQNEKYLRLVSGSIFFSFKTQWVELYIWQVTTTSYKNSRKHILHWTFSPYSSGNCMAIVESVVFHPTKKWFHGHCNKYRKGRYGMKLA